MNNFENFKFYNNIDLPSWFDENVFNIVYQIVKDKNKLLATKYLMDVSSENNTRDKYGLTWGKTVIVDQIGIMIEKTSDKSDNKELLENETNKILKPFFELAHEVLENSLMASRMDNVLYAFNHKQITMQDLKNLLLLQK